MTTGEASRSLGDWAHRVKVVPPGKGLRGSVVPQLGVFPEQAIRGAKGSLVLRAKERPGQVEDELVRWGVMGSREAREGATRTAQTTVEDSRKAGQSDRGSDPGGMRNTKRTTHIYKVGNKE